MLRGFAWTGSIKWIAQGFSWITTLVVARFLDPSAYGIMGVAAVFLGLLGLLAEFGVGNAVVLRHDLSRRTHQELAGFSLGMGLVAGAACVALAPLSASFFNQEELTLALPVLGLGFALSGLRTVPSSLLQRDLEFKRLAFVDAATSASASILAVYMAVAGWGYWSLIVPQLLGSLFGVVMVWWWHPVGLRRPTGDVFTQVGWLSGHLLLQRLAWYSYTHVDAIIIGRRLGQDALGNYTFGVQLALTPSEKINQMVMRVMSGVFSAVQDDAAQLRRYLLSLIEFIALPVFPILVFLSFLSDWLAVNIFGDQWADLGAPLAILAASALLRSITPVVVQALTAIQDMGFLSRNTLFLAALMPVGFLIGAQWGVTGVAAAWLIVYPLPILLVFWRCARMLEFPIHAYGQAIARPIAMTIGAVAVFYSVRWGSSSLIEGESLPIVIGIVTSVVLYLIVAFALYLEKARQIMEMAR